MVCVLFLNLGFLFDTGKSLFKKNTMKPGVVAHACNPSYIRGGDWKD
jgi:hypothetical protein